MGVYTVWILFNFSLALRRLQLFCYSKCNFIPLLFCAFLRFLSTQKCVNGSMRGRTAVPQWAIQPCIKSVSAWPAFSYYSLCSPFVCEPAQDAGQLFTTGKRSTDTFEVVFTLETVLVPLLLCFVAPLGPGSQELQGALCIVWPAASICTTLLMLHYSPTTKALNRGINLKLCPEEMAFGDELYPYEWDGFVPHESTSCCNNQIFVLYANAGLGSIQLNCVLCSSILLCTFIQAFRKNRPKSLNKNLIQIFLKPFYDDILTRVNRKSYTRWQGVKIQERHTVGKVSFSRHLFSVYVHYCLNILDQ